MKRGLQGKASFVETVEQTAGVLVGKITGLDKSGQVLVDFPGNTQGPVGARITTSAKARTQGGGDLAGREVLLVFENNDSSLPVIIDTLYSLLDDISEAPAPVMEAEKPDEVFVDGERVIFDAKEEIVLRCGKASITLTRAGKVLIRGAYLLSRSSGVNRLKGGSVQIN